MPVITTATQRTAQTAQTEDSWKQPHRTLMANTKAATSSNPYSAALKDPVEAPETTEEVGQASIPKEEIKTQEAVTLSPQLTALARREQKFRQQEQAFKAQQAAFEAEKAEVATLKELKAKLAAKDYSVLEAEGLTYDEYTNYKINQAEGEKPEVQALNQIREELNTIKSDQKKNEEKHFEQIKSQYRSDIKALVASDEQFSSVKEMGAEDHVLQHILDTFEQDDEVLTVAQAAQEVEEQLVLEAEKMAGLSKLKAKLKSQEPEKKVLPPPQKSGLKTLTQQIAPSVQNKFPQSQHLSPRERLAQALAKAQRPQT